MTDEPRTPEYEDDFEPEPPRTLLAGALVFLIAALAAVAIGTVLTVLAHYSSTWLGVSEVALLVSYVGMIGTGALLFVAADIRQELEYRRLQEERDEIYRVLSEIPGGDAEAEEGKTRHRARPSRRARRTRR